MHLFVLSEKRAHLFSKTTLLCKSAILAKGLSFVTLYTDFSFKQLKEITVEAKGKSFSSLVSKAFFFKE